MDQTNRSASLHTPKVGLAAVCVITTLAGTAAAQSIPVQYLHALQRAEYQIFSGDVNGDGYTDVLAKAKVKITMIDFDVLIPIPLKPSSPTFVLLSSNGGSYTLDANPSRERIAHPAWQPSSHDIVFGDVSGGGNTAMLLRARIVGQPSFVITTSPANGAPTLWQELSPDVLGIDISGAPNSVVLRDSNRDGRADLVLSTDEVMTTVLLADANGRFARPQGDESVLMAWRVFCSALDAGDLTSALSQVTTRSQETYLGALVGVGNEITTLSSNWSDIRSVEQREDYAVFSLISTYEGRRRIHLIVLMKEGGRWLIEHF